MAPYGLSATTSGPRSWCLSPTAGPVAAYNRADVPLDWVDRRGGITSEDARRWRTSG